MPKLTPAERSELEAERDFLVRSLEDLETERADGGMDDGTYETLHSDYTARAASVMRSLASGTVPKDGAAASKRPRMSTGRRALMVGGIVVFAGIAAFSLAQTSGTRATGGLPTGGVTTPTAAPNSYEGHLEAAERFRAEGLVDQATKEYLAAARLRPRSAEPLTSLADMLLLRFANGLSNDERLITQAGNLIDHALQLDPKYAPAYLDRGLVARASGKPVSESIADFRKYLELDPNGARANMARTLIDQFTAPSTTTPSTSTQSTSSGPTTTTRP